MLALSYADPYVRQGKHTTILFSFILISVAEAPRILGEEREGFQSPVHIFFGREEEYSICSPSPFRNFLFSLSFPPLHVFRGTHPSSGEAAVSSDRGAHKNQSEGLTG